MRDELNCEIVKDLMPNYIEELTGDYTNEVMKNHLDNCESCSKTYEFLSKKDPNESVENNNINEVKTLKWYMKKVRRKNLLLGIIVACIIVFSANLIYDKLVNTALYNEPTANVEVTELYQLDDNYVYFTIKSKSDYLVSSMSIGQAKVGDDYVGMEITFSRPIVGKKLSKVSEEERAVNSGVSFVIDIKNNNVIDVGSVVRRNRNATKDEIIDYVKNEAEEIDKVSIGNHHNNVYYIGKSEDDKLLIWEEGMKLPKYPN